MHPPRACPGSFPGLTLWDSDTLRHYFAFPQQIIIPPMYQSPETTLRYTMGPTSQYIMLVSFE